MFWNKNNKTTPGYFDNQESSSGTADNTFGLFYENQQTCACGDECCFLLEGGSDTDTILLEGLLDCISQEGCAIDPSTSFLQALINQFVP
jgi:hypothetical protein